MLTFSFFLSFSFILTSLPSHCKCKVLLLYLITLIDTHTRNRLDSSGRMIGLTQRLMHGNTQHWQKDNHAPDGIRIRIPSKRAAANPSLGPHGYRDRQIPERLFTFVESTKFSSFPKLVWELCFATFVAPQVLPQRQISDYSNLSGYCAVFFVVLAGLIYASNLSKSHWFISTEALSLVRQRPYALSLRRSRIDTCSLFRTHDVKESLELSTTFLNWSNLTFTNPNQLL
jgi:hypothetical protein